MQGQDTDRVKVDDGVWSVKCLECGRWFEAKRSDATYCSVRCRKLSAQRPARKAAALKEIAGMAARCRSIANQYPKSQDVLDALGALEALIKKQRALMDVEWKPKQLEL